MSSTLPASAAAPPSGTRRADAFEQRDRFLAFAFAAADLLVETDTAGSITFAAGAFRSRFGEAPEAFIGRPLSCLIAPQDQATLAIATSVLLARGRLAPIGIRIRDAGHSAFALAGLAPLGTGISGRLCLTLGPVPAPPDSVAVAPAASFGREVEGRVRAAALQGGDAGMLGLLDLGADAAAAFRRLPDLAAELGEQLAASLGGALAGELVPGRYGLLPGAGDPGGLPALAARMEAVLLQHGVAANVVAQELPLQTDRLTPVQAVRALRYALGTFTRDGAAGLARQGIGGGLAACVARVSSRVATLRRSIAEGRFDLGYQPIVDLSSGAIHHYEALIRPHTAGDPDVAAPQDFVLFAETMGLTEELDFAVARRVLGALGRSPVPLACNLSGLSVQSPAFRERLLGMIERHGAGARNLTIEVTESTEIEDEAEAARTLNALRDRGLAVCIDDFGAGAAAFRYLRVFRVDYVKVDGLYVHNAVRTERDRSFVAAMVDLSLAVGAKVIAERIETEEDARVMRDLGVHYGQGFLFGRAAPLPAALRPKPQDGAWA